MVCVEGMCSSRMCSSMMEIWMEGKVECGMGMVVGGRSSLLL
jgi:hypothetical protein